MFLNRSIRPLLYNLDVIDRNNFRRFSRCKSFMLYRNLIDYMKYWRHLENNSFQSLTEDAQDELYYHFTEHMLMIFDCYLDLYWLIHDIDRKPLFLSGREPSDFYRKRICLKERLPRLQYAFS